MTVAGLLASFLPGPTTPIQLIGSVGTQSVSVLSYSQSVPSGATGDLLLLIYTATNNPASTPAGWTQLFQNQNAQVYINIFYKTAAAASESNFTVTMTQTNPTNVYSGIFRFRNANTVPAINSGGAFNYNTTGSVSYPAVTSGVSTDYNIQFAYFFNPSVTVATPSGSTSLLVDNDSTSPSFFTFFDIGVGVNKSSTFTQSSSNPAYSAQIRIRAA